MTADAPEALRVNGRPHPWRSGLTVSELLRELRQPEGAVAVERNARVVRRQDHASTLLERGDEVELVRLVGGG